MSTGMQNMKTGLDTLRTAENESGSANMITGLDALHTAENVSGSTKHENGTLRLRYRRKRERGCKT
jgi:hypothetical protein